MGLDCFWGEQIFGPMDLLKCSIKMYVSVALKACLLKTVGMD